MNNLWYTAKGAVLYLLLTLISTGAPAQENIHFQTITTDDGLSDDRILCLLQDHMGYLWVGTSNGLNRFDGHRVVVFKDDANQPGGLRGNWINCVFEDSKRRLWVGTDKGVNLLRRGSTQFEFVPMNEDEEATDLYEITKLTEDRQGKMWLATRLDGLFRLGPEEPNGNWSVRQFLPDPDNVNSLLTNKSDDLTMNPPGSPLENGSLDDLIVFSDKGLLRVNTIAETIERISNHSKLDLWNSYEVETSNLLRTSQRTGINLDTLLDASIKLLGPNAVLEIEAHNAPAVPYGPGPYADFILDLAVTGGDQVWANSFRGLFHLDLSTGVKTVFYHSPFKKGSLVSSEIGCLLSDKDGNLWIGTRTSGLNLLPNGNSPFEHYSHKPNDSGTISSDNVVSLTMDDEDNLWVRTYDHHFEKLSFVPGKGRIRTQSQTLSLIDILKMKNGNFFMPSSSEGLIEFDPTASVIEVYPYLPGDSVYPVYHFSPLCEDRRGDIWMGIRGALGVFKWDSAAKQLIDFRNHKLLSETVGDKSITQIFQDRSGNLWFTTDRGIYIFDEDITDVQTLIHEPADPGSLTGSKVWSVFEDSQGVFWISTNYGLNRYDRQRKEIRRFYEGDGLPNNVVWDVLEDDLQRIWVSTNAGLARSNFIVGEDPAVYSGSLFRTFGRHPGLMRDGYRLGVNWKDIRTGQLLFGGKRGFNVIHPERVVVDTLQPTIAISSLAISGQSKKQKRDRVDHFITGRDNLRLSYLDDVVTLWVSDFNFKDYDENKFQYQLAGLSDQWIPLAENREITFIDLSPGHYALQIRGTTSSDIEIPSQELLKIRVVPPWWKSIWAYALYTLALAGLIFFFYRFQLSRLLAKQENRRLKELDQFKSRLYTNITHEFRTPLTVILGMADRLASLAETTPVSRIHKEIGLVRRNGRNLLQLINQLLDLSKVEDNRLEINYMQGDIVRYVHYVTESFHSLANAQNIMLWVEARQTGIVMDYDSEKFRQILSNLLSNAIKYTPSGGKVIVKVNEGKTKNQPYLHLSVSDNGAGIPVEDLPMIFDRFYQADDAIAKSGGTGVGLALTKELVRLMNGTIDVESSIEAGTTFYVKLPIHLKATAATFFTGPGGLEKSGVGLSSVSNTFPVANITTQPDERASLLIIEDNPDVMEYLVFCLENRYRLEFAYNGSAGIEKALEEVPDIIISDVMMPGKDGFEVCETLKNDLRTSHIPIVLLTAKADLESRIDGLSCGADTYLKKPFNQAELLLILKNHLHARQRMQIRYNRASDQLLDTSQPGHELEDAFILQLKELIDDNLDNSEFGIPQLCRSIGLSRSQLHKKIKALTGYSTSIYWRSIRLQHAKQLLETSDSNVSEVAYQVGFKDPKYFSRLYVAAYGMPPSEAKKAGLS